MGCRYYLLAVSLILGVMLVSSMVSVQALKTPVIKGPKLYAEKPITGNYGNIIAVQLTPPCLALAKINATSLCPTYKVLEPFDTTNKKISGTFYYDDLFYHRGKGQYKNWQLSYPPSKFPLVVCIDCTKQIIDHSPVIYVKSSDDFSYVSSGKNKMVNSTRIEFDKRFVEPDCMSATIAWYPSLLNDTINYIFNKCKFDSSNPTAFNETKVIYTKPTKLIYDSYWYKYLKWLEEAKKHKAENCLKSDKC